MRSARQVTVVILVGIREHAAKLMLVTNEQEMAANCSDRIVRLVSGRVAAAGI